MSDGGPASDRQRLATTSGAALGTGLMALGAVLGALILLWLAVNLAGGQLRAGGFVLGLMLLAVFALPLVGAGWYLRGRGAAEAGAAAAFADRRAALDADQVVRRQLARELEQRAAGLLQSADALAPDLAAPVRAAGRRLRDLAEDVARPGYDASTWLDRPGGAAPEELATIRRYDDLVLEEVRRLDGLEHEIARRPEAMARLVSDVETLERHLGEREALFGRGKRAPALAPQELLAAGARPRRRLDTPLELRLDDAVSLEQSDFLVRAVLNYFAGGRSWRAYQLHDGKQERWLEVRAPEYDTIWYEARPAPAAPADERVELDGTLFTTREAGSATVDVESAAGRQEGIYVEYRRYEADDGTRLVLERWPDGPRALYGRPIASEDLQLWTKSPATE